MINILNMQSPVFCALKQIAQNTPDFETFKENLIDELIKRDPESHHIDGINPYSYINFPLQDINICDITNSDNLLDRADMQIINIKRGVPGGHGVAIGRHVQSPIAVKMTDTGTYDIIDGFHRPLQSIMNGDKTILAFIVDGNVGLTLKEFYNQARIGLS